MQLQEASAAHDGMLPAHRLTSSRLLTWLAARVSFLQRFSIVQGFARDKAGHDNVQNNVQCPALQLKAVFDCFCKSYCFGPSAVCVHEFSANYVV